MFPNVRLMIAAVVASVVALSCGFGVFAAFRVNHEPLARLSTATAQLVVDSATPPAATLAAGETFGSRFQLSEAQIAGATAGLPALKLGRWGSVEPPSAVAMAGPGPEAGVAEPEQPVAVAQLVETEPEAKQDGAAIASGEPPPAASDTAAIEAPTDQAPPVEQATQAPQPETATTTAATGVAKIHHKIARKIASRQRLAARAQRARETRARAIAQSDTRNSAYPQPNFQSAPAPSQTQTVTSRRSAQTSAVGGPFVSPPSH